MQRILSKSSPGVLTPRAEYYESRPLLSGRVLFLRASNPWRRAGLVSPRTTALWVSGGNEMIANSADGGYHWTTRYLLKPGDLVFAFAFPAPPIVLAFGSAGVWLESPGDGATWRRQANGPYQPVVQ